MCGVLIGDAKGSLSGRCHCINILSEFSNFRINQSIILFADTNVSQWAHAIQRSIDYDINNRTLNTEIA